MKKNATDFDIILTVLKESEAAFPKSDFIKSLLGQYQERGSLSKKQLEGLYDKASKIRSISPGKLATIQAIILKKPTRYKSIISETLTQTPDIVTKQMIGAILGSYPEHKRVLYFKMKNDKDEQLTAPEKEELLKFHKLLV